MWLLYDTENPQYRALVIRKNVEDLKDWTDRAREMYSGTGAQFIGKPVEIHFPSGAKIYTGHLKDENAFTKYQGHEYCRMLIEELTHIPSEEQYLKLIASCRSTTGLKPQVFATTNPGGVGHSTRFGEVLTTKGWKEIRDVTETDSVFSLLPTGKIVIRRVKNPYKRLVNEELVRVKARGLYMEMTADHKVARPTKGGIKLTPYKDLPGQVTVVRAGEWQGREISEVIIPRAPTRNTGNKQPMALSGRDYAEFMGWFVAEGCLNKDGIGISQTKEPQRSSIRALLDRVGIKYREDKRGFNFYSVHWLSFLKKQGFQQTRFVPQLIKDASRSELEAFFQAAMAGDGHWASKNGGAYYTTSRQLADDMAEVAIKLGYIVSITERNRAGRLKCWTVNVKKTKSKGTEILTGNHVYQVKTKTKRRTDVERIPYKGYVFGFGVEETHNFFIRQNGSVWVSGNSWVKKRFIEPSPPGTTFKDAISSRTRVFVPATVEDNPTLMEKDPDYVSFLDSLPEDLREQWRRGNWNINIVKGAYFQQDLEQASKEGRLTRVPFNRYQTVFVAFDLGISIGNDMVMTFFQIDGKEIKIFRCLSDVDQPYGHYVQALKEQIFKWGYNIGKIFLPHDGAKRSQDTLKTFKDLLEEAGFLVEIIPQISEKQKDIELLRTTFPRLWFDTDGCQTLLEALAVYRRQWVEERGVYQDKPYHDWSSNYSDCMMVLARAVSLMPTTTKPAPTNYGFKVQKGYTKRIF